MEGSLPARVPSMDSVDDPLRRAASTVNNAARGGQFFVSPGGQFRMSFDTESEQLALLIETAAPRVRIRFPPARVVQTIGSSPMALLLLPEALPLLQITAGAV